MNAAGLACARGLAALVLAFSIASAQAGRSCEDKPPEAASLQRGIELAARTADALDASGAQVVVLARAGQDLSKYRLRWSHLGWAYRDDTSSPAVWRVVHKLNQCGSARGGLYRQGLIEFFTDDPYEFVAGVAVPAPEVQARLLPLLRDNTAVARLQEPAYSMVAHPWSQTYQQSNQWAIETLALAQDPGATTRAQAQAWLRAQAYAPTTLHLSALTRLGARLTAANVAFDDHPNDQRFSDRIETVTADSVFDWLQRRGLAGAVQLVR